MNSKERFLTGLRNDIPDRVPCAPDISNYIPCKRTGLPFWDIYFHEKIPLWHAYLDAADYFGIDAWLASCVSAPFEYNESSLEQLCEYRFDENKDAMFKHTTFRTPDGDLKAVDICFRHDPPTALEKPVKDLATDLKKYRWIHRAPAGIDMKTVDKMRQACEERNYAFGLCMSFSGFQNWQYFVEGGVMTLTYAEMDMPEQLEALNEYEFDIGVKEMELLISAEPDYILFGGSGTITLASPALAEKYAIPALKKYSEMAKAANIPTHLHSCGRSRELVDMLVNETDVGSINPLEIAPMGDINLAEVKKTRGDGIGLMGNLHTTDVMLNGTPDQVCRKSIEAMRDAGLRGGFILSTGDQCGPATPDENIFAMVEAAKKYGRYNSDGNLPDLPPE